MEHLNSRISIRLKDLRKEHGLSQLEASKRLKIDRSTIAKYETGAASPSVYLLVDLARMYRVSTDYILGLSDQSIA